MTSNLTAVAASLEQAADNLFASITKAAPGDIKRPAVTGHLHRAVHSVMWVAARMTEVTRNPAGPCEEQEFAAADAALDALVLAVAALAEFAEAAEFADDPAPTAA